MKEVLKEEELIKNNKKIIFINENGENLGIKDISEGLELANELNLDLVIVKEDEIPICKVIDLKKTEYKKKRALRNGKQKQIKNKEIRINMDISENDLKTKVRNIDGFLEKKSKVKIVIRSHGIRSTVDIQTQMREFMYDRILSNIKNKYEIDGKENSSHNEFSINIHS